MNVHRLDVKPKLSRHTYKRHDITVSYIPKDKEFLWSFHETTTMSFNGREPTANAALAAAKAQVDDLQEAATHHARSLPD